MRSFPTISRGMTQADLVKLVYIEEFERRMGDTFIYIHFVKFKSIAEFG